MSPVEAPDGTEAIEQIPSRQTSTSIVGVPLLSMISLANIFSIDDIL